MERAALAWAPSWEARLAGVAAYTLASALGLRALGRATARPVRQAAVPASATQAQHQAAAPRSR
jgi:hypothetical protein